MFDCHRGDQQQSGRKKPKLDLVVSLVFRIQNTFKNENGPGHFLYIEIVDNKIMQVYIFEQVLLHRPEL